MAAGTDTVFALATAPGRGGIAVVRLSGPQALSALSALGRRGDWIPRRATRVRLRDADDAALDEGLALWFPAPASFTGEDVVELHLHGGRAVTAAVLAALAARPGLRPAEPGEFSRRAFENGKLDLTQVEALADLVAAETRAQREQALRQLGGDLGRLYESWRERLVAASAQLEAAIDFADEDLPPGLEERMRAEAAALAGDIARHLDDGGRGERIREGFTVVLAGPPNAGKSSLFNALAGRAAAIVDAEPGTTRDALEVPLDVEGLPVVLVDTAGLRATASGVEREGVRRARAHAAAADLQLVVVDGGEWPEIHAEATALLARPETLVVIGKADLGRVPAAATVAGVESVVVSALTGAGLPELWAAIGRRLRRIGDGRAAEAPVLTRLRHRSTLQACGAALAGVATARGVEEAAEELRSAATHLGRITGRVDVEELLGRIFAEFCIGK